jgi:predicted permease
LPPGFQFLDQSADLWLPLGLDPAKDYIAAGFGRFLSAPARLKQGVTIERARAEMKYLAGQLQQQQPVFNAGWGINIVTLNNQIIGNIGRTLLILFGAVAFVLLIACANIANLRLSQFSAREKEIAIRAALGATRPGLIRLLLTENIVIAVLGGALGFLLAFWLVKILVTLAPSDIPRLSEIGLDGRVLGFTLFLSLLAGIISGLVPAWNTSLLDLNETLKEGGQSAGAGTGPRGKTLRGIFIVAQVALVMMLLTGAGLMIRSFHRLQTTQIGFDPANLLTMHLLLPESYEMKKRTAFFEQAVQRVGSVPGVQSVTAVSNLPFSQLRLSPVFMVEGRHLPQSVDKPRADLRIVCSNYFKTMGIPLVTGRDFTPRDIREDDAKVVIINETLARQYWPNESPLGRRLIINRADNSPDEIIGVVKDVKTFGLDTDVTPTIYWPHHRFPFPSATLVTRTKSDPLNLTASVTAEIRAIDPQQAIADVQTMEQVLWSSVQRPRFYTLLLAIFAVVALALAVMGIYGVMSYLVSERIHEFGLRIALGATTFAILKFVLKQGMMLALTGILLGLGASFALTRVLSGLLYEVKPTDPVTFFGVALLFFAVSLLACYIPARRATRVDPIVTLKHE